MIIAGKTPNDKKKIKDTAKKVAKKVVKKSEYFDDGYDFGDVTKTILSTSADVATNVGKGFMNTIEGAVDAGRILLGDLTKASANAQANIWEFFGNKDYANSLRQAGQQIKDYEYKNATVDVTGTLLGENNAIFNKNWSKELHEKSVAGDLTTSVSQGVGNMGAFVGLSGIGGLAAKGAGLLGAGATSTNALTTLTSNAGSTFLNSFSSAFGNTMTNGLNNGLTEKEARGQAFTSGMAEAISEQFFQGIPGLKTAGWADDLISKPVEKYFGGKTGKIALRILDSLGEGYEEELSNVLQATFEGIRNGKNVKDIFDDAKAQSFFNSAETREAFISALISSALTNGGTMIINNSQKNSIIKSYAQEHGITEQQTRELFDSIVEKRANLEDAKNFKERAEIEEGISKQLRNEIKQDIKGENKLDLNELFEQTPNSKKEMQFRFNQDEAKNVKSEKQNILANDMARLNDEKSNHELYKVVNAIQSANDTQQYHITTTEGLYEMGIVKKNSKGEYVMPDGSPYVPRGLNYKNGEIYINADVGSQSGTQAVYHEMFEGFKKAAPKQYKEFKQMVTDIIGEDAIQSEYDTYKSMYGEELTDDIRDEIINDKFGELAESQDFINRISDNRTLLQKFIDTVKNMINYVKGTEEERKLIKLQKELEKQFAKRYKETDFSTNKGDTAYSLNDYETYQNELNESLNNAKNISEDFYNNMKNQMDEYKERHPLEYNIYEQTKSRPATNENYNSDFFKEHRSDYDEKSGTNTADGRLTVLHLQKGDNLAKLSFTENQDKIWIDELYVKNQKQGYGSEIVNAIKEYADKTGKYVEAFKELQTAKVFWDKTLRSDTKYSLSSTKDSQGRNLTPQQQEYFKDSKVVDEDGNLLEVYHGQNSEHYTYRNPGNKFNNDFASNKMFEGTEITMFTSSEEIADSYIDNEDNPDMKPVKAYLNITNPYIVDAKNQSNQYFLDNDGTPTNVNNLVKRIYDSGEYDGVIIKNVADIGEYYEYDITDGRQYATDYIVFNSNQIKNVDNTNPTSNEDIRYSLAPTKDNTGKELTKEQQKYFKDSKIKDKDGNLMEVYHGTNNDFTIFDKSYLGSASGDLGFLGDGFYFATHSGEAKYYGNKNMAVYLNVTNPFNIKNLQKYNGMNLRGEQSNPYIEIKNLVNMNPEWADIKIGYGNTYGDVANATDEVLQNISVEYLGKNEDGSKRYKINNGERFDYVNALNDYSTDELIADEFYREMRSRFGSIDSSEVIQYITSEAQFKKINGDKPIKTFSEVLQDNGYDGIMQDTTADRTDEIVVFNPNQIKNVDNLNPTEDDDIRNSLTSNENIDSKEIAPVGSTVEETIAPIREDISNLSNQLNNLSNQIQTLQNGAEMTSSEEIAPVNPYRERAIAQREANQTIDEIQKDENYWKSLEVLANEEGMSALDDKSARKLSRNIGKELGLKQKQVKDLQSIINDAFNNGYSLDQIKDELYNSFGHDSVTIKNEEAIAAQQQIKDYKIKVSPKIQKDIADYGYWKQQYFGKIKFSNEGSPVDVVYGQLSEQNPAMFPNDIWNETDQLLRIAEVADMSKKYSMDYEMDENTLNETANYIYDTFNETLYANAIKSANDLEQNALQYNERTKDIPYKKRTRQEVREFLQSGMGITKQDLQQGNDIKSTQYNLDTPERVNEKVFGREVGRKINEQTVYFAKHQEAERTRFLNKERQEIKDLGIKARSKESALVQQYGEGIIGDTELAQEVRDKATQEKIKNAAKVLRSKYDTYLDQINEELVDMGYDPIPKRKDYMRHFQELTDKFSQAGIPFNRQDLNSENLPTDINGLTEFNVPGKNWFASANRRTGEKTTYDAITGIDGYLEGASNLMYHTETIQRYRALEKLIRDTYGQTHGLDEFNGDISSEDAMQRVQDIQNGKLSNYAAWIKEQGNAIAGKKGALDRGFERALGRRAYTLASTLKKQVGSNMTGFNVRSALTNFISSTIAAAKTNKLAMIRGTIDTIQNMFHDDGFINRSDFLTSRFGSDSLSQKTWQKISNAGQILMRGSDWFTSNLITRSKYYEGIQKGMTDTQAMNYANDFAARVMGDRSKGATAEAFNSKTMGFLTQFQLETNNQWQYMIHDTKMEYQENLAKDGGLKAGATVLFQVGQLAAYSYLFNEMFEKLTGSRAAFDPFDILKKLFGLDPDDEDKTFEERMKEAGSELVDALPFASLFGSGGRLPISEMLTPFQTTYDYITGGTNKYGQDITLKDVGKETLETLPYYLLPTGYGQLKKAKQGLGMYSKDLPTPGSYTDSGNLRFTADTDTGSIIKNALFGQWSGEEAKKYRESGYKTIRANNIQEMLDLGMNSSEYREYKEGLTKSGSKNSDKINYINNLDVTDEQKNIMAENVLKRDTDMSNYGDYGSYEEFDYAYKNPTKYKTMVAIANNYQNYQDYIAGIDNVRDKYSQAKGYTTEQRKKKVAKYVNSLDLTIPQKAMLMRQYYSSFNNYNKEIVNYVSSLDMEYDEKVEILKVLKMKVDKNGNVSW